MKYFFLSILITASSLLQGQYAMNLGTTISPLRSISHKVGYTDVKITYSSPAVNGREIWGALEPYGDVWRAGANYATTVSFSENVIIEGKPIDKGTYSLFIIPHKDSDWVIILNKKAKQWGAFRYSEDEDLIRVTATPQNIEHQESLRYDIISSDNGSGAIALRWDKMKVEFLFETKLADALTSVLEKNLSSGTSATRWINYLQAAEILVNENHALPKATEWINQAEQDSQLEMEWNPKFYPKDYIMGHLYWTKAKILAIQDQYKEALAYTNKLKNIVGQSFYSKENEAEEIDQKIKDWSQKN